VLLILFTFAKSFNLASGAAFGRQQGLLHPLIDHAGPAETNALKQVALSNTASTAAAATPSIGVPNGFCATGWVLEVNDGKPAWRCSKPGDKMKTKLDLSFANSKGVTNRLGIREELVWLTEMDRDACAGDNHGECADPTTRITSFSLEVTRYVLTSRLRQLRRPVSEFAVAHRPADPKSSVALVECRLYEAGRGGRADMHEWTRKERSRRQDWLRPN
jgi:hypothetical protein